MHEVNFGWNWIGVFSSSIFLVVRLFFAASVGVLVLARFIALLLQ
jgi:hypothetical protein